jgi:predicted metal-dependent hydrolase
MEPLGFDPFNNRQARDIRNKLAKSFLAALTAKDALLFQSCISAYRQMNLHESYKRYVTDRLAKYEEAYSRIALENRRDVLQQAATLWDLKLYYEMHEILEPEWRMAAGEKRKALQGLIRAAGMKIHAESNRDKAAASMGAKALADLLQYGRELQGFGNFEAVLAEIEKTIAANGGRSNGGKNPVMR